jgi:hypothetical protein
MEDTAAAVSKPPDLTKFSRGYLAFFGTRLAGQIPGRRVVAVRSRFSQ